MKKKLLPLLLVQAALTLGLSPAFGQSVWEEIPTSPAPGIAGYITSFVSPQANVVWATTGRYPVHAMTPEPSVFSSANDWQTGSFYTPQYTASTTSFDPTATFSDVAALDGQTAWLVGTTTLAAGAAPVPTLWKTTTGAQGFTVLTTAAPAASRKIHFFTAIAGVAICAAPAGVTAWRIFRTTDAGLTWTALAATPAVTASTGEYLWDKISVPGDANSLWVKTEAGMLHTADAGLSWTAVPGVQWVAFRDAANGLAIQGTGSSRQLLRTADGGTTWAAVAVTGLPVMNTLAAVPGLPGTYISGGYTLPASPITAPTISQTAITRDQGATWQVISTDKILFRKIIAYSPTQVWAYADYSNSPQDNPQREFMRLKANVLAARQPQDPALQAQAYPNPTSGKLQLTGSLQGEEVVRVYDAAGRQCYTGKVSAAQRMVDLSAQRAGLYQLLLTSANGSTRSLKVSKTE